MTPLSVVVALNTKVLVAPQLFGIEQLLAVVVQSEIELEGGEEALHHGVIPAANLG